MTSNTKLTPVNKVPIECVFAIVAANPWGQYLEVENPTVVNGIPFENNTIQNTYDDLPSYEMMCEYTICEGNGFICHISGEWTADFVHLIEIDSAGVISIYETSAEIILPAEFVRNKESVTVVVPARRIWRAHIDNTENIYIVQNIEHRDIMKDEIVSISIEAHLSVPVE